MDQEVEQRFAALERRLSRAERMAESTVRAFGGPLFPLLDVGASREQADEVWDYLEAAASAVIAGNGPTPSEFRARISQILPMATGADPDFAGRLVTWCFGTHRLEFLYGWFRDSGLPGLETAIEQTNPDWRSKQARNVEHF